MVTSLWRGNDLREDAHKGGKAGGGLEEFVGPLVLGKALGSAPVFSFYVTEGFLIRPGFCLYPGSERGLHMGTQEGSTEDGVQE